jgi:hypothetical protein
MIVEYLQTAHSQAGLRFPKVNIDCAVGEPNRPEDVIHINVNVVVVNLCRKICRSDRTGVDVQSDKAECALVPMPIRADELALAEAHVRLVRHRRGLARDCVYRGPAAADMRHTHESVEVRDLRRIADAGQRVGGVQWVVMDEDAERSEWRNATRNRVWAATVVIVGTGRIRTYKAAAKDCARCRRRKERATRSTRTDIR